MDIPINLVEEFAEGNGVIFVGPRLSRDSGVIGPEELLSQLADQIELPANLRANLPKVAQYYENHYNRQTLLQYVIRQTDAHGKNPTDNHHKLLRFGARTWITTNYDDLIERVFHQSQGRITKIVRDQNVPYTNADSVSLVKLHGDREQPDTMVITQNDYQTYFRRFPRIKEKVSSLLLENTFLFIGYDDNSPEFDQILAEMAYDLQEHQRMAYAILFDANRFTVSELASRNVTVLNLPESSQSRQAKILGGFLDELIRQVEHARQKIHTKPRQVSEAAYRDWLRDETDSIDIRGIGNRNAPGRFPLFELYVPLHAREISPIIESGMEKRISLEDILNRQKHTTVVGGPGTGKTTFLRYLARKIVDDPNSPMPLLMQASSLYAYLTEPGSKRNEITSETLIDYWLKRSESQGWEFEFTWFQNQLRRGYFQFLLDGLDELPDESGRQQITKIIDSSVKKWPKCKWVVTSRPTVYQSFTPLNFSVFTIDQLTDSDIRKFVHSWVSILYHGMTVTSEPRSNLSATRYEQELLEAIRENIDVRLLARNPVMLTAIAVMHWNEMKLPAGKAELYKIIINWLIRARRDYPQKPNNNLTLDCYQRLALAMFNHSEGLKTSVGRAWAAEQIADILPNPDGREKTKIALEFLEYEEINTGIIVSREGGNVAFWHFSFQEYLAAFEIATKTDDEATGWWSLLKDNLFYPQWIEVLRFIPTIFYLSLGRGRVDLFVKRILAGRKEDSLIETARTVGLLGSVLLDLSVHDYAIDHVDEYLRARDQVMQVFTTNGPALDFPARYEVAVALGRWGDPRLAHPEENWIWLQRGIATIGAQSRESKKTNYDEFAHSSEGPVFETFSASFEIGKFPVTVQEYKQFVNDEGYEMEELWSPDGWDWRSNNKIVVPNHWDEQLEYPNKPIIYVGWFEAQAYCSWLSSKDRSMVYRLPTGNEWEYMARHATNQYSRYVFGNIAPIDVNLEMNFDHSGTEKLAPVGLFPHDSTADGVMDVNGNIWEWTHDIGEQNYLPGLHQASLIQKQNSNLRYRRGGGWHDVPASHRTSSRSLVSAQNRYDDTGFRVLRRYAPVVFKGKSPDQERYSTTLADVYAKYDSQKFSTAKTDERLKNYADQFSSSLNCGVIKQLFPNEIPDIDSLLERPMPTLAQATKDKFEFNLYYQDSRIKLAVEEKLGPLADSSQYQSEASNLLEVVANLLSTEGLSGRELWKDLTDNDLDGLIVMILHHYDPDRIQRLLDIGNFSNKRALASLPRLDELTLEKLIQYQVFAGPEWWTDPGSTLIDQFAFLGEFEIDDRKKFEREVLGDDCNLMFFLRDNGELVWDLALIERLLQLNPTLHVTGVVSSQVIFNNATVETVKKCLEQPIFRNIKLSSRFELIGEDNPRSAIDPLFCSQELKERMENATLAFIKGVAFFETMQNLVLDAYYAFIVQRTDSQICTGLKAGSGVFVNIPRGKSGFRYRQQNLRELYPLLSQTV